MSSFSKFCSSLRGRFALAVLTAVVSCPPQPATAQEDTSKIPAIGPSGARSIDLATNAMNLAFDAQPLGTASAEIRESGTGSDDQKNFLFGTTSNVRFDCRYRVGPYKMTYLVASNNDTVVLAFRGTDRSIVYAGDGDEAKLNWPASYKTHKLHELLNGEDSLTASILGKPYGGGGGVEGLAEGGTEFINFFGADKDVPAVLRGERAKTIDKYFGDVMVHAGWAHAAAVTWVDLKPLLDAHGAKSKSVIVTGHSMGGCIAVYTSYIMLGDRYFTQDKAHQLVTFGAPWVGAERTLPPQKSFSPGFQARVEQLSPRGKFQIRKVEINGDPTPEVWKKAVENVSNSKLAFHLYSFLGNRIIFLSPNVVQNDPHNFHNYFSAVTRRSQHPATQLDYNFRTLTADKSGAGTDANLTVTITGDKGVIGPFVLNPLLRGNALERGDVDWCRLQLKNNIGNIRKITIKSDRKYPGSDWALNSVVIQPADGEEGEYAFPAGNNWIEDQKNDTFVLTNPVFRRRTVDLPLP